MNLLKRVGHVFSLYCANWNGVVIDCYQQEEGNELVIVFLCEQHTLSEGSNCISKETGSNQILWEETSMGVDPSKVKNPTPTRMMVVWSWSSSNQLEMTFQILSAASSLLVCLSSHASSLVSGLMVSFNHLESPHTLFISVAACNPPKRHAQTKFPNCLAKDESALAADNYNSCRLTLSWAK